MSDSADPPSPGAVLNRLRNSPNDPVAWEQFFQLTWPFVLAMSHRSLPAARRLVDADDITQEVFLKFARYWREKQPALDDPDGLFSLLAVMTRRMAGDAGRWLTRSRRDSRRNQSPEGQGRVSRADHEAEIELRDLLEKVSGMLDAQERQVLSLRLQDYELSEIAEELGVATRTIERRMQRLREVLSPYLKLQE